MIVTGKDFIVGPWVCDRTGGTYTEGTTIGLEKDGALVAGVLYDHYNGASIAMHVAAVGKRWMTREFLHFCFWYPFKQLKVKKVIGMVPSSNEQAMRFDKHLGFREEARVKDAHPEGDLVILTMTEKDCRFLRGSYGKQIQSPAPAYA